MIGWLYQSYGRDAVRGLWTSGLDALTRRLRERPDELTRAWHRWVARSVAPVPADDLAVIQRRGCG